jgi:hypothetical protein
MNSHEQNQDPGKHLREDDFPNKQDYFNEIVHHLQQSQFLKSLNPEKLNELIQKFKNSFANSAFDDLKNRFAAKDKDFLIKLIKSIS